MARIREGVTVQAMSTYVAGRSSSVRTAGLLCLVGAIIGVAGGLVTGFISPAVASDRFSYPYTPTGYVVAEISFAVNHVLLLVGVLGVARSGAVGDRRLGRVGVRVSVVGLVALTLCELVAITLADSAYPTSQTDLLETGYGISTILIGVGLVMAGTGVVRTGRWSGWSRYVVLACGVAVFVVVIPGVFGPFLVGRLVLTFWMLMFAGLGYALIHNASQPSAGIERVSEPGGAARKT